MTRIHLVQHAEKRRDSTDPGLTDLGREQAERVARWLSSRGLGGRGLGAVHSSPLRRARETAAPIAATAGLPVQVDDRLRERMNWDSDQPFDEFLADWGRATTDRDHLPRTGDSSRQAAERLRQFLHEQAGRSTTIAVVTHGGVTVDLLRTVLGDSAVPAALIDDGVPAGAITTFEDLDVIAVAQLAPATPVVSGP